jgi:hypothetical protein
MTSSVCTTNDESTVCVAVPSPPVLRQRSPGSASSCARHDVAAWMITGSW